MTDKPDQLKVSRREMNKALGGAPLMLSSDDEGGILEWLLGDDKEDSPPGITIVNDQGEVIADDINELEFDVSFDIQIDEAGEPRAILSVPGAGDDNWGIGSDGILRPSSNEVEGVDIGGSLSAGASRVTNGVVRAHLDPDHYRDYKVSDYGTLAASLNAADADMGAYGGHMDIGATANEKNVDETIELSNRNGISGTGFQSTKLYAVDGFASDIVFWEGGNETWFGNTLEDLYIRGDESQSSGHNIHIGQNVKDSELNHVWSHGAAQDGLLAETSWGLHLTRSLFEACNGFGLNIETSDQSHLAHIFSAYNGDDGVRMNGRKGVLTDVWGWNNDKYGLHVSGDDNTLMGCWANINTFGGFFITSQGTTLSSCTARNNSSGGAYAGFQINGDDTRLLGCRSYDDQATPDQAYGYRISGNNTVLVACESSGNANEDVVIESGSVDTNLVACGGLITSISDNGTRSRWNGVIGGGPLDGVDLSATTGQFVGDLAIADGTSTGVTAGDPARWDGTGWGYINRDGTI